MTIAEVADRLVFGCHERREMTNYFLIFGALAGVGWVLVGGSQPSSEPVVKPSVTQSADIGSSLAPGPGNGPSAPLEMRRDPVPLVRKFHAAPVAAIVPDVT